MSDTDEEKLGSGIKVKNKELILYLQKKHHDKLLSHQPFLLSHANLISTENPHKVELQVSSKVHSRYRKAIREKKGLKFLKSDFSGGSINLKNIGNQIINTAKSARNIIKKYIPKDAVKLGLTAGLTALSPETAPLNAIASNTATNLLYGGNNKLTSKSTQKFLHMPNGTLLKGIPLRNDIGGSYDIPLSNDVHTFSTRKRLNKV